ncbi:hypothetical protein HS088_TW05G00323 [Tripterygium wilfordii]|uniref:Uncharacterized protein n=1 Tax=Tripterygium wilfordii TaxID=458696 RepID=A0A7J7DMP1_TRIWF|nr:hypothetical protein HS088_TW05G00323 [Tripterygium wilfordii]
MTNANTIHASRKFKKRWPCQKLRDSVCGTDAETAVAVAVAVAVALLDSFNCSIDALSLPNVTFRAIEWQISQVLAKK